ncbi:MAG: hypothetical protein K2Q10_14595 [Rhodospirillales bacterium]|nr:hypothetical protein [Rhodospirillales bacterium]
MRAMFGATVMGLALAIAQPALGAAVEGLRIGAHPGKMRFVLDLSGPASVVPELSADGRIVVIPLKGLAWQAARNGTGAFGTWAYQSGDQGERLVIHARRPVTLAESAGISPEGGRSHRFYFDLAEAGAAPVRPYSMAVVRPLAPVAKPAGMAAIPPQEAAVPLTDEMSNVALSGLTATAGRSSAKEWADGYPLLQLPLNKELDDVRWMMRRKSGDDSL